MPILTYIEQKAMFYAYANFGCLDIGGGNPAGTILYAAGNNLTYVSSQRVSTFTCPSDTPTQVGSITNHNDVLNAGNTSFYQVQIPIRCTGGSVTIEP